MGGVNGPDLAAGLGRAVRRVDDWLADLDVESEDCPSADTLGGIETLLRFARASTSTPAGLGQRFHEAAMRHDDRLSVGWDDLEQRQRDTYDAAAAEALAPAATDGVRWSARYFTDEEATNEPPGWSTGWNVLGELGDDPDPLVRVVYVLAIDQAHDGDGGDCSTWLARNVVATLNARDVERELHDAHYVGAGESERSHDAWAQRRGFNSSGELHAWVDEQLAVVAWDRSTAEGESAGHSIRDRLAGDEGLTGDEQLAVSPDAARCTPGGEG